MRKLLLILFLCAPAYAEQYRQVFDLNGQVSTASVQRVSDGAIIPLVAGNRDYKDYQDWIKSGNAVLPATPAQVIDPVKAQAKTDLNNASKTDAQRIDAIIKYLSLDK